MQIDMLNLTIDMYVSLLAKTLLSEGRLHAFQSTRQTLLYTTNHFNFNISLKERQTVYLLVLTQ